MTIVINIRRWHTIALAIIAALALAALPLAYKEGAASQSQYLDAAYDCGYHDGYSAADAKGVAR